jgi:hypothetical protein
VDGELGKVVGQVCANAIGQRGGVFVHGVVSRTQYMSRWCKVWAATMGT